MFQLTEAERILVLVVCLSLVALTVLVTACTVIPSCWLYGFLHRWSKRRKMKYGDIDGLSEGTFIKLNGTPQYTVDCCLQPQVTDTSLIENFDHVTKNSRKREDSTYSSMSSSSQGNASISNYQTEPCIETSVIDCGQKACYGQVTFTAWCKISGNGPTWQLMIVLKEAAYLPSRLYGGVCDPYMVLRLFKEKSRKRWSKSRPSILYEFRTTTVRKSQHPFYKETFIMDITKADLKEDALKIAIFDDEKYANDSELGELVISLRDIPFSEHGEEILITRCFNEPKEELGEILFSMSFLPTAERITFNIVKANNLKVITSDLNYFAPFVRVLLLHNEKVVRKKKTSTKPGTSNPVFNESLTFDLPPSQLDRVVFLIVASHRDVSDGSVSSPDSPTTPSNSSSRKKRHIGKVVIGSSTKGTSLNHWNAMKHSPRKQVEQWHVLR